MGLPHRQMGLPEGKYTNGEVNPSTSHRWYTVGEVNPSTAHRWYTVGEGNPSTGGVKYTNSEGYASIIKEKESKVAVNISVEVVEYIRNDINIT